MVEKQKGIINFIYVIGAWPI